MQTRFRLFLYYILISLTNLLQEFTHLKELQYGALSDTCFQTELTEAMANSYLIAYIPKNFTLRTTNLPK